MMFSDALSSWNMQLHKHHTTDRVHVLTRLS